MLSPRLQKLKVKSCEQDNLSVATIVVQDPTTDTPLLIQKISNGVVDPNALRDNSMTYADFGLPANLDYFERLELARVNASTIADLEQKLTTINDDKNETQGNNPTAVTANPSSAEPPAPAGVQ